MLTIPAPAKLNLTLEVLSRRPDGFHEIRSVLQTIDLCDTLRFRSSDGVEFCSSAAGWSAEQSLVSRAVKLVREQTGSTRGVTVEVIKNIPLVSGLGGDSSDAAAVLRGLNELWGLGLGMADLQPLAATLGSDVPFFLHGGTDLASGRGEVITPLPPLPRGWVVLLIPQVPRLPGKTARLYARLNPGHYSAGQNTRGMVNQLNSGGGIKPSRLFNVFDAVAPDAFTGLAGYRARFLAAGAGDVHLAGSGPALFAWFDRRAQAEPIYQNLVKEGMETYLAATLAGKQLSAS